MLNCCFSYNDCCYLCYSYLCYSCLPDSLWRKWMMAQSPHRKVTVLAYLLYYFLYWFLCFRKTLHSMFTGWWEREHKLLAVVWQVSSKGMRRQQCSFHGRAEIHSKQEKWWLTLGLCSGMPTEHQAGTDPTLPNFGALPSRYDSSPWPSCHIKDGMLWCSAW